MASIDTEEKEKERKEGRQKERKAYLKATTNTVRSDTRTIRRNVGQNDLLTEIVSGKTRPPRGVLQAE